MLFRSPLCLRSPVATWRRRVCPSSSQRTLGARIAASSTIPPTRRATASSGPRYRQSRAYLAGSFCRRSAATSKDPPNCLRPSLPKRSAPSDWAGMTTLRPLPGIQKFTFGGQTTPPRSRIIAFAIRGTSRSCPGWWCRRRLIGPPERPPRVRRWRAGQRPSR